MRAKRRLERVAKAEGAPVYAGPPSVIRLPYNGFRPPGRYPIRGTNAVIVVYDSGYVPSDPSTRPETPCPPRP